VAVNIGRGELRAKIDEGDPIILLEVGEGLFSEVRGRKGGARTLD
jgi:hypothetical protein